MQFLPTSRKTRRGFSLIEVILALGVVSASVLALIGILGSTFTSAREIALQHRAINAVTQLDGAFQSASGIVGLTAGTPADPAFDRIYKTLAAQGALNGSKFVDIFVYQKMDDRSPAVPVVFMPSTAGRFTIEETKTAQHEGIDTSSVFRMRVRLSLLMKGKLYQLNQSSFEPVQTAWSVGTSLPGTPDEYALAYLPLSVEIFPHDFSGSTDPGNDPDVTKELVRPILTQTVVINR